MIEVSVLLFSLLTEGFVILLIILLIGVLVLFKKKKADRVAASKLVDQLKKQSQVRLEVTGSFLQDKYRFEGEELKKAVKAIDKSEKKFFQKLINLYLKRDADALASMDSCVAELVDIYKSLSPVMPEVDAGTGSQELQEKEKEIEDLRASNGKLAEELEITKTTMGNMISEFGNMFGGGHDHELAKHEVMEKVKEKEMEVEEARTAADEQAAEVEATDSSDDIEIDEAVEVDVSEPESDPLQPQVEVESDDEVDDLLDSIDLSSDKP